MQEPFEEESPYSRGKKTVILRWQIFTCIVPLTQNLEAQKLQICTKSLKNCHASVADFDLYRNYVPLTQNLEAQKLQICTKSLKNCHASVADFDLYRNYVPLTQNLEAQKLQICTISCSLTLSIIIMWYIKRVEKEEREFNVLHLSSMVERLVCFTFDMKTSSGRSDWVFAVLGSKVTHRRWAWHSSCPREVSSCL